MSDPTSAVKVEGLTLMPPTQARNYWRIKGTLPDGRMIDTTGGRSFSDAQAKAQTAITQAATPQQRGAARHVNVRYAKLLAEYVKPENHEEWGKGGGSRNAATTKSMLWTHVLPVLGNRTCESLVPSDFRGILQSMRSQGYSPATVKRVGECMRGTVTFMRNERYIEQGYDPMQGVTYRARAVTGQAWVPYEDRPTVADKDALADGMAIWGGQRWWVATHLAGLAGPRWGELLYLTPRHFDLERCQILIERQWSEQSRPTPAGVTGKGLPGGHFVAAMPKNGRERTITYPAWLNPYLEELIEQVRAEHAQTIKSSGRSRNPLELMFCTKAGTIPWRGAWGRDVINPAREYAKWPSERVEVARKENGRYVRKAFNEYRWSWHSLRHLFCSLTISTGEHGYGLDAAEGAKLAGHTLEVFMKTYVQVPSDFTEKTARHMANVPGPVTRARKAGAA